MPVRQNAKRDRTQRAAPSALRRDRRIGVVFSCDNFEEMQMESLRSIASASQITPTLIRVRALAGIVRMTGTISLSKLMQALLAPVSFHANITTTSGTALGGTSISRSPTMATIPLMCICTTADTTPTIFAFAAPSNRRADSRCYFRPADTPTAQGRNIGQPQPRFQSQRKRIQPQIKRSGWMCAPLRCPLAKAIKTPESSALLKTSQKICSAFSSPM